MLRLRRESRIASRRRGTFTFDIEMPKPPFRRPPMLVLLLPADVIIMVGIDVTIDISSAPKRLRSLPESWYASMAAQKTADSLHAAFTCRNIFLRQLLLSTAFTIDRDIYQPLPLIVFSRRIAVDYAASH